MAKKFLRKEALLAFANARGGKRVGEGTVAGLYRIAARQSYEVLKARNLYNAVTDPETVSATSKEGRALLAYAAETDETTVKKAVVKAERKAAKTLLLLNSVAREEEMSFIEGYVSESSYADLVDEFLRLAD